MSRRAHSTLTIVTIALACVVCPGVGSTHGRLEMDPTAAQRKAPQGIRIAPVMVPSRMNRTSLETFGFGPERLARLERRIAPERPGVQRIAIDKVGQLGRSVGRAGTKLSNPVMSAFANLVDSTAAADRALMQGTHVIALQHMLGSTGGLLRGLVELGARPDDIFALGKKYSQSAPVMDELAKEGFRVRVAQRESEGDMTMSIDNMGMVPSAGHGVGGHATFVAAGGRFSDVKRDRKGELDEAIASLVASVKKNPDPKARVLVLDDGGELIQRIQDEHPELHDRVVAVEQTRKGIRRLEAMKLSFPVIDVAQSNAKLEFESPMIGESIAKTTMERIARIERQGQVVPRRILAISYGAVGKAACQALRRGGFQVQIYDRSPAARHRAQADGFRTYETEDEALAHGDVVLSMTGETVLDSAALNKLPDGALLINGASSSTELLPDRMDLMRGLVMNSTETTVDETKVFGRYRGKRFELGAVKTTGSYRPERTVQGFDFPALVVAPGKLPTDRSNKTVLLVNQGEVVNFDGSVDPIPPRFIQLTRGLLFLGSVQAMKTTAPGIHALSDETQKHWVAAVQKDLETTSESLTAPQF